MRAHFLIGSFTFNRSLRQAIAAPLDESSYQVHTEADLESFFQWVQDNQHRIDCLVLEFSDDLSPQLQRLKNQSTLLPVLLVEPTIAAPAESKTKAPQVSPSCKRLATSYHAKVMCVLQAELTQLDNYIQQAMNQFLTLPDHRAALSNRPTSETGDSHFTLSLQQQRLAEKLRERLGYFGVYYKRDPKNFVRNLDQPQQADLFDQLRTEYRRLVLSYFQDNVRLNDNIDNLVNTLFFADISVSKLVEMHMELMENFAKQLKMEGRSEEILLDYRLTLIDVIA
ncbi:MAG: circadian clock protein KaiA, partial [Cyanobacteria bacterium P01_H01_bin.153]